MDTWNLANIGSGYHLLPDSTKPSPKWMLNHHQWSSVAFNIEQIEEEMLKKSITTIYLEMTYSQ